MIINYRPILFPKQISCPKKDTKFILLSIVNRRYKNNLFILKKDIEHDYRHDDRLVYIPNIVANFLCIRLAKTTYFAYTKIRLVFSDPIYRDSWFGNLLVSL